MNIKLTAFGLVVGMAAVFPTMNEAVADHSVMLLNSDPNDLAPTRERNGILQLRPKDEEHTIEQASFVCDPVNRDVCMAVVMSTGTLDGPAGPNTGAVLPQGNIQGAALPFRIVADPTTESGINLQLDLANYKYVSNRDADDNRAYHHPEAMAIGNNMFALFNNWDRDNGNNNTERYVQVVDAQANLQQLTANVTRREGNTSAMIMAKNNDNCSGGQAGEKSDIYIDAQGVAHIASFELCNGNGKDDGWVNAMAISCNAGTCNVDKKFDTSVITREERSRGNAIFVNTTGQTGAAPDMILACGTEGNSQPQREGVWCAGVDANTGERLYRERVAYRGQTEEGQRTYAMRIKALAIKDINGVKSGEVALQYQMHRGNNNMNRKGGYDDAVMIAIAKPNRTSLNMSAPQDFTQAVINAQLEMTHATMMQTFTGTAEAPVPTFSFLSGNHFGNAAFKAKVVDMQLVNGTMLNMGERSMDVPYDHQKYSKYLGNNPNNQGRSYNDCDIVPNPFVADSGVPVFEMCAITGKVNDPENPARKPDLLMNISVPVKPTAQTPDPVQPEPDAEFPTAPSDDVNPANPVNPSSPGGSASLGGCSVSGDSMGGSAALLLLGLGLALRRRRS